MKIISWLSLVKFKIPIGEGGGSYKIATLYDTWNVPKGKVVKIGKVCGNSVGKYLKLEDGSKQYAKILNVYRDHVQTSNGLYYKWQLLPDATPRAPYTEYSGARKGYEHFLVKPPTEEEMDQALTNFREGKVEGSARVQSMAQNLFETRMKAKGVTKEDFIDTVIDMAGRKGKDQLPALKICMNASGLGELVTEKKKIEQTNVNANLEMSVVEQLGGVVNTDPQGAIGMDDADYELVEIDDEGNEYVVQQDGSEQDSGCDYSDIED